MNCVQIKQIILQNKKKTERTIIYNYVKSRDYLNTASYMGRDINIDQDKRARNFADMVRKEKKKKYPGVMRFRLKKQYTFIALNVSTQFIDYVSIQMYRI